MEKNKNLKIWGTLFLLLATPLVFGQDAPAAAESSSFQITLATLLYVFGSILLVIAIAIWRIAVHLKKYIRQEFKTEEEEDRTFWEKIFQLKSTSTDRDTIIDHPHDGIYELDNPAPPWFMWMFYLTIIFAVVYFIRFNFTDWGYTQAEEYIEEVKLAETEQAANLEKAGNAIDENSVEFLTDEATIAKGKAIFDGNCQVCHGQYGQGAVGPNFTDAYYLHGGSIKDIFKTIKYGVVEKGMQAWAQQLSPVAMQQVASYVKSLKGTKPPVEGKEPQGTLYDESAEGAAAEVTNDSNIVATDTTEVK